MIKTSEFQNEINKLEFVEVKVEAIPSWIKLPLLYSADGLIVLVLNEHINVKEGKVKIKFHNKKYEYNVCGEVIKANKTNFIVKISNLIRYDNKREHGRIEILINCNFTLAEEIHCGEIKNISKTGVLISTNLHLAIDDKIIVDFEYSGIKCTISGKVVRIEKVQNGLNYGIQFDDQRNKTKLLKIIKQLQETKSTNQSSLVNKNLSILLNDFKIDIEYVNLIEKMGINVFRTTSIESFILNNIQNSYNDILIIDLNDYDATIDTLKQINNYLKDSQQSVVVILPQEDMDKWLSDYGDKELSVVFRPMMEQELEMALLKHI